MHLFALKTLLADRGKLLTAIGGVVFSLVLVNVQGGLFFGLIHKASRLVDQTDADIWIGHRLVENVDFAYEIPQSQINRIRGLSGIKRAEPYIVGKGVASLSNGGYEDVWIIGFDSHSQLGVGGSFVEGDAQDLRRPDSVSIDELDAQKLGFPETGDVLEINGQRAKVVAKTHGILGFLTTPYVFCTLSNARRYAQIPEGSCSYFLVQADNGADLAQLQARIQDLLPDLDVYTTKEFRALSQNYFLRRTGIGISFGGATLLGLLVGLLMVGQSLYALALDHLSDYATLKAIGAEDRQICWIVVLQAISVATVGSVIGVVLVVQLQHWLSTPIAPIDIPLRLLFGGIVLVFCICFASSILPFLRIRRVDPATVLQG